MQITVWSVAADDDNGTYASVHATERAAYRRLIQMTVDADNKDDVAKAEAFIEAEDFDGLDEWIHEDVIEPLNLGYHLETGHKLSFQNRPTGLAEDVIVLPCRSMFQQGAFPHFRTGVWVSSHSSSGSSSEDSPR
ncbi:MAG: hypothetical protein ABR905_21690 [Terracidiphilus sp.]|jgi:hypothetical protein